MPKGVYVRTKRDPVVRFWEKVDFNGPIPPYRRDLGNCWLWTGAVGRDDGYGVFHVERSGKTSRTRKAHIVAFNLTAGDVPDGLELDHLCCVRQCVRPSHLEPVTRLENLARGGHNNRYKITCPQGHPYDAENTRWGKRRPERHCRECHRAHSLAYWRRKHGKVPS